MKATGGPAGLFPSDGRRLRADGPTEPTAGRIRVLQLLWSGGMGGAERHVFDLAIALPRDRFAVEVCFLARKDAYGPILEARSVPVHEIRLRSGNDVLGIARYLRWLRGRRFDIVHDHLSAPWARPVTAWARTGAVIVATEHSGLLLEGYGPVRRMFCRWSARHTKRTIAVSDAMRQALIRIVPGHAGRILVLPNLVDGSRFPARPENERRELRRLLEIPEEAPILLAVGRLEADKGYDRLLSLLGPVFTRYPLLRLLIVGEGSLRPFLEDEAARLSLAHRVRLLGRRDDVPRLCDLCDILVFPTRYESFGIVAAEAMMAGRPVVAPRMPGLDEVVRSGETGILVDPSRLEADFPAAVESLLDDPERRTRLGQTGREEAFRRFELKRVASRIADLYMEALAPRRAAER